MKIHTLTSDQLAIIPQVRDEWRATALSTAPVDRAKVQENLTNLFALADRPAPRHIIYLDSPLQIAVAIGSLRAIDVEACWQVTDAISGEVRSQTRKVMAGRINQRSTSLIVDQNRFEFTVAHLAPELPFVQQIRDQTRDQIRILFPRLKAWSFGDDFGQLDVSLAWFDFLGRLGIDVSEFAPSFGLAKSCGWAVLFWEWAFICARPECIHCDDRGRPHCETGAAIRYPDGFSIFAIHGVRVPERIIVAPKSITTAEIESEANAEVRRVMIQRYGTGRYLLDSQTEEIHRDDFGILYRKQIPGDEPLLMVQVVNATPEPDGSYKDYFLRVPPTMVRARAAVAWTFGKDENEYAPAFQT